MKVKFKSKYCKIENIFDTNDTIASLSEGDRVRKVDTYMPACSNCGKRDSVDVKRQ